MSAPGPLLIVPAVEPGGGGGHLVRSLFLLKQLNDPEREAFLWIPEQLKTQVFSRFGEFFGEPGSSPGPESRLLFKKEELSGRAWSCIILDRFRTPPEEFSFWSALGPLVGIDEGGASRNRFDFLVDLLPGLSAHGPNRAAPGLLPLPRNRRPPETGVPEPGKEPPKILISFGAEDAAGLGRAAAAILSAQKPDTPPLRVTLVAAGTRAPGENPALRVIPPFPGLREHLSGYDLFVTHFGLGAFEAVYARVPVLLISPTAYHEKLARNAGFFSLGVKGRGLRKLKNLIADRRFIEGLGKRGAEIARRFGLEEPPREDLAAFISSLEISSPRTCPVCAEKAALPLPVRARFPEESFRRCGRCGAFFMGRLKAPPIEYEKDYFFDFYKKQYGKTYIEDFPNLKEMGRRRLGHIRSLLAAGKSGGSSARAAAPSLLDIGCAYGPFLAAAAEAGFSPAGLDPAEDAVRYVRDELGIPAWRGFFPDALPPGERLPARYDAVTLWYVIEHLDDPGKALADINRLLKEGGVLAFSTPSFSGISGRKSIGAFLQGSPADHRTIWSPGICRKVFKQYGFRLKRIVVTGHHPERFPFLGRFVNPARKNLLFRLLFLASRLFRLGDTFEAYGAKRPTAF